MHRQLLRRFVKKWKAYRHRFVPWVAWSMPNRTVGVVVHPASQAPLVSDASIEQQLRCILELLSTFDADAARTVLPPERDLAMRLQTLHHAIGFAVERRSSTLEDGGTGVFVSAGTIPTGSIVSFYPGTVYEPFEPLLIASLRNPYIFRCADGYLIDGKDRGLSKAIHRSCTRREQRGQYLTNDLTWMTRHPRNPMAIGQYVNNCDAEHAANVAYHEYLVPNALPLHLRQYVPNAFYSSASEAGHYRLTKMVLLISLRDIHENEELFSTYITIVT